MLRNNNNNHGNRQFRADQSAQQAQQQAQPGLNTEQSTAAQQIRVIKQGHLPRKQRGRGSCGGCHSPDHALKDCTEAVSMDNEGHIKGCLPCNDVRHTLASCSLAHGLATVKNHYIFHRQNRAPGILPAELTDPLFQETFRTAKPWTLAFAQQQKLLGLLASGVPDPAWQLFAENPQQAPPSTLHSSITQAHVDFFREGNGRWRGNELSTRAGNAGTGSGHNSNSRGRGNFHGSSRGNYQGNSRGGYQGGNYTQNSQQPYNSKQPYNSQNSYHQRKRRYDDDDEDDEDSRQPKRPRQAPIDDLERREREAELKLKEAEAEKKRVEADKEKFELEKQRFLFQQSHPSQVHSQATRASFIPIQMPTVNDSQHALYQQPHHNPQPYHNPQPSFPPQAYNHQPYREDRHAEDESEDESGDKSGKPSQLKRQQTEALIKKEPGIKTEPRVKREFETP